MKVKMELPKSEQFKAVAFYLARLHRVQPEGERLKKTQEEIDDMSLATIEHMAGKISDKVKADYLSAVARKKG